MKHCTLVKSHCLMCSPFSVLHSILAHLYVDDHWCYNGHTPGNQFIVGMYCQWASTLTSLSLVLCVSFILLFCSLGFKAFINNETQLLTKSNLKWNPLKYLKVEVQSTILILETATHSLKHAWVKECSWIYVSVFRKQGPSQHFQECPWLPKNKKTKCNTLSTNKKNLN